MQAGKHVWLGLPHLTSGTALLPRATEQGGTFLVASAALSSYHV